MSEEKRGAQGASGIGFVGLLTIVFITLKLCGVIQWSWWWVLSPLWISALVFVAMLAIFAGIMLCWYLFAYRGRRK